MSDLKIDHEQLSKALKTLIKSGTANQYVLFFKKFHEADIAECVSDLTPEEKETFFKKINPESAADILEILDKDEQIEIISKFKVTSAAKFIEEMDPDNAVDLLEELSETNELKAQKIINALPEKEKSDIQTLLAYEESSAGSLMTSSYLSIPENLIVSEALSSIKKQHPPESELSFYIFITSTDNKLVGYTTLRDLVFSSNKTKVKSLRHEHHISIDHYADQEEVAQLFQKYDMSVIPVVNEANHLLGAITVDDIVDVVVEEASEDIYKLSGTSSLTKPNPLSISITKTIFYRIPWLIIGIFGGVIASGIINAYSNSFNNSIFPLALSLSFIPLIMGLSGNVGNQSSAIIVRGLATGTIKDNQTWATLFHELMVSLCIGSIISTILFLINHFFFNYSLIFSSIVSISLLGNIIVAAIVGTLLPLLFNKLAIDPAIASAPFISTTLDIICQLIYFSITLATIQYLLV
jgi:magnesium transporter